LAFRRDVRLLAVPTRLKKHIGRTAQTDISDFGPTFEQLRRLSEENRQLPDRARERELLQLRIKAGAELAFWSGDERRELIEPDYGGLPSGAVVPEVPAEELTAGLIRAAILRNGSLLVRGLVDRDAATEVAKGIDRAYAAREAFQNGGTTSEDGYYEELQAEFPQPTPHRKAVQEGGGLLAVDSPRVAFGVFELFEQADLRRIVSEYLSEPAAVSDNKTTLRKTDPKVPGAWHQDGKFLGDVNSLNLWLPLSHCGDTAPGLDIVPRRLEEIVDAGWTETGFTSIVVLPEQAEELAGETGIVSPIFEPGDGLFFDHLFLHQTGSRPGMTDHRFAVESWFFGPSAFPEGYVPLAC
jgi:hypothetical protein